MAKNATEQALAAIRQKIEPLETTLNGLRIAEAALLDAGAGESTPEKPKKRGRGKNKPKPGLPTQEQEATF